MKRLAETVQFAVMSAALFVLLAITVVGYSCFRHGDIGPYPETAVVPWLAPLSMLVVFVLRSK